VVSIHLQKIPLPLDLITGGGLLTAILVRRARRRATV
jgi:hypothetical protein